MNARALSILTTKVPYPWHRRIAWAALASLPISASLSLQFFRAHGYFPNIKKPRKFNEKIIHQKVSGFGPLYTTMSDKIGVKQHVEQLLGSEWVIPTIWHGTSLPEKRDWPLPWIMKSNHASGWNYIARTAADLNWPGIETRMKSWVSTPWPAHKFEEFYNRFPRQALVEPLIGPIDRDIADFKLFVFGGRAEFIQVDVGRRREHKRSFYDRDWRLAPFAFKHPPLDDPFPRPPHLSEMISAAEILGSNFPFARVDLYDLESGPKFGEITFTPSSGSRYILSARLRSDPRRNVALIR